MGRSRLLLPLLVALAAWGLGSAPAGAERDPEGAFRAAALRARQLYDAGQYGPAASLADSLYRATERHEGPEAPRTCEAIELAVDCAFSLRYRPDPATCELADRAMRIRERTDSPDSLKLLHALQLAARCAQRSGDLDRAIGLQRRGAVIEERAHGAESYNLSVQLNNLASMLYDAGRYGEVIEILRRALAIREKGLARDDPARLVIVNNLAAGYDAAGDYAAATPLFEEVLAGYEKHLGPGHGKTGYALNNLATVLAATGAPDRAIALYRRALAVREHATGVNEFEIAETLANLADLLLEQGDTTGVRALYERALEIQTRVLNVDNRYRVQSLLGLAAVSRTARDWDAARERAREALDAIERGEQPVNPSAALALVSLGETELAAGEPAAALAPLERAVELCRRALGDRHPRLAEARRELAEAQVRAGDPRALAQALEAERIARDHLRHTFRTLPERQALAVREGTPPALDAALSALAAMPEPPDSARRTVWDALVRSRGLLLDEMASRIHFGTGGDTAVAGLARGFIAARQREVNLAVRGPRDESPDEYRARLERAREVGDDAEAALARASGEFRRELARSRVGLEEVMAQLPPGAALIAYVRYARVPAPSAAPGAGAPRAEDEYAAFVGRGAEAPRFVTLGAASTIDSLVTAWRRAAQDPGDDEPAYRRAALRLRRRIWDPLAPRLRRAGIAFVVPDGALALVSLATMPVGEGTYLVERGPALQYLTTERELVAEPPTSARAAGEMVAVGGVAYDAAATRPATAVWAATPAARSARAHASPASTDCADLASLRFAALPQTRREIEDVCVMWKGRGAGGSARTLTGASATEDSFRVVAPRGRILHLATHGYFVADRCADGAPGAAAGDTMPGDPFVRSGLALAGANARSSPDGSGDDGLLTAAEIAALELQGVEWVVLTGCDTGLGSPSSLEGLLGMRWAFQVAGARTLVMSLWGVEDAPTRRWARALYQARLRRNESAPAAVRDAARALLEAQRAGGDGGHPCAWGAFVSSGEWR